MDICARRIATAVVVAGAMLLGGSSATALAADYAVSPGANNQVAKELDPENSQNQVLAFKTDETHFGNVFRSLGAGIKATELDNQLQLKYYLQGTKTCVLGSPRVVLDVDKDNNNTIDGRAFGYLGDQAFGGGCPMNEWTFEDMTNSAPKWDLSQLGGGMTLTWDQVETYLQSSSPNYRVKSVRLNEDPATAGNPATSGCTFYDQVGFYRSDLTQWSDIPGATQNTSLCPEAPPAPPVF